MTDHPARPLRWYHGLTKYHWAVLAIGVLSWMFDVMDQRLFVLSRAPAIKELIGWTEREKEIRPGIEAEAAREIDAEVGAGTRPAEGRDDALAARIREKIASAYDEAFKSKVDSLGDLVTALMVIGWSVGGFLFGIYGDKLGRVRTLAIAISVYSLFTGLSGLASGIIDFCVYRFVMGCGIGGAFATAATLIAETMPDHARAFSLGLFQALSALGNITGSAVALMISPDYPTKLLGLVPGGVSGWRVLFMIGILPAILVVVIMRFVKEPEAWRAARKTASENLERQLGDIKSLFVTPRWRRNTIVGISLAVVGVIGLWGVGFYSPELVETALGGLPQREVSTWKALGTLVQDVGALLGMLAFTYVATRLGRRLAFGGAFVFCWIIVSGVFLLYSAPWHSLVLLPLLGFATLSLFGGYSIYFPEIYPTRLRSTGTGFCYNVGRVLAALAIIGKIPIRNVFASLGFSQPFRSVSVLLAGVYVLGLVVLIWAPETKGKPLPTED
ncbi:MAG: MFS transporter [Planctomycetes bacterium]|nr:MFS transporter [Planctomycetota bacterium]